MSAAIASNLDHIHITLDTLIEVGDYASASHIVQTVGPVWETHEYLMEGRHYTSLLLSATCSGKLTGGAYAQVCHLAGNLARHQSDYTEARFHYLNGLKTPMTNGRIHVGILSGLGEVAFRQGRYQTAYEHYEHHRLISLDFGSQTGVADALTALGRISMATGNLGEARELFEQSQRICQDQNYELGMGWLLNALGELERAAQNYQQAVTHYTQSIRYFAQVENLGAEMLVRQNLAFAYLAIGNATRAAELFFEVLGFWQKGQSVHGIMLCLIGWSALLFQQHRYTAAAQLLAYAQNQLERTGVVLELGDRLHYEHMLSMVQKKISQTHYDDIALQTRDISTNHLISLIDRSSAVPQTHSVHLTPREYEILRLAVQGLSDKEIAGCCVISPHTVNAHLRNIYRKLNVNTRTEAAYTAQRLNLIR
jgi:ATP/maltotriose-dependent transcriptional regulator MalT